MNWRNVKPLNGNFLAVLEQEEEIELPVGENTLKVFNRNAPKNHFRILGLPPDWQHSDIFIDDMVFVPNLNVKRLADRFLCKDAGQSVYILHQSMVYGVCNADGYFAPVGQRVLVKRRIGTEILLDSKIIIPAFIQSKDQTLDCEVVSLGMLPNSMPWPDTELKPGCLVTLTKWDMSHIEIQDPDGNYLLLVDRRFISHITAERASLIEFDQPTQY